MAENSIQPEYLPAPPRAKRAQDIIRIVVTLGVALRLVLSPGGISEAWHSGLLGLMSLNALASLPGMFGTRFGIPAFLKSAVDIVLFMPLLHFTGGSRSPFLWFVPLTLILSALTVSWKQLAVLLPLAMVSLTAGIGPDQVATPDLIIIVSLAGATAIGTSRFRIMYDQERLKAKRAINAQVDLVREREELLSTAARLQEIEDSADIYQRMAESIMRLVPCEALSFYEVNWKGRFLQPAFALGKEAKEVMSGGFPLDKGITGAIAISGVAEIVNNALGDPRAFHVPGTVDEEEAIMAIPLSAAGRTSDVLCLYRLGSSSFRDEELETAHLFAAQAEVALRNARLLRQSRRRAKLLATLLDLGREISSSLMVDHICRILHTKAHSVLDATVFFIAVLEEDQETIDYLYMIDRNESLSHLRMPHTGTLAGLAIDAGRTVILDKDTIQKTARRFKEWIAPTCGIVTPMYAMNRVVGALSVQSYAPDAYDDEAVLALEIMARQAGAALQNAYLYQQARNAFDEIEKSQNETIEAEKMRVRGEMGKNVAHEFNNLLMTIMGRTEVLLSTPLDSERRRAVEIIRERAEFGSAIIRDIAKMQPVATAAQLVPLSVGSVLESIIKETRDAHSAQRHWRVQVQEPDYEIRLPKDKATVIFSHIFSSISAAMPRGGTLTVSMKPSSDESMNIRIMALEQSTTGETPSASLLSGAQGDYGRGIRRARLILSELGGDLERTTEETGSLIISMNLPREQDAGTARSLRILVVDDEQSVRDVLIDMLRLLGHRPSGVESGIEALDAIQHGSYDLVFSDLGMPGMDGSTLVHEIRKRFETLPIILVSGWGLDGCRELTLEFDRLWVLDKPVQIQQMRAMLTAVTRALNGGG